MLEHPSGRKYKLVYLDTNFLSEFINNYNNFAVNVIKKFTGNEYMFCTSIFNIYELSKTNNEFEEKMSEAFDKIPFGIVIDYQKMFLSEKKKHLSSNDIIWGAFGIKPLFNLDIHDLFVILKKLENIKSIREQLINNEISIWNKKRKLGNKNNNFRSRLLESMNEIGNEIDGFSPVSALGKYKSLECMAYIKNEFIYNTKIDIKSNSIIDMYNICVLPYVEAYATENFVGKKISNEMRKKLLYVKAEVYYINDFRTPPHHQI